MSATPVLTKPTTEAGLVAALQAMSYGEYIVGSSDEDDVPNGMMADWVMQVAFKPHMLAASFENDARTLANIRTNGFFSVNLLPQDETGRKLYAKFAQPYFDAKIVGRRHTASPDGIHHKLEGIPYQLTANGSPVLSDAFGWLEAEARDFIDVGDHTLVIATVVAGDVVREAEPLTSGYTGWTYAG